MAHPYKTAESAAMVLELFKILEKGGYRPVSISSDACGLRPHTIKSKIQSGFTWLLENVDEKTKLTWEIHRTNCKLQVTPYGLVVAYRKPLASYTVASLDHERMQLRASLDQWLRGCRKVGDTWPTHEIVIPLSEDDYQYFTDVLMREREHGYTALIDRTTARVVFSFIPMSATKVTNDTAN